MFYRLVRRLPAQIAVRPASARWCIENAPFREFCLSSLRPTPTRLVCRVFRVFAKFPCRRLWLIPKPACRISAEPHQEHISSCANSIAMRLDVRNAKAPLVRRGFRNFRAHDAPTRTVRYRTGNVKHRIKAICRHNSYQSPPNRAPPELCCRTDQKLVFNSWAECCHPRLIDIADNHFVMRENSFDVGNDCI